MPFRLIVPLRIYEEMVAQALLERPNECCGLLGGIMEICTDGSRVGRVVKRYPLLNEAKSPVEFFNGGKDLFQATRDMQNRSLDTLAVYHSHPSSPPVPSKKDRAMNWSEGVVNVILSLMTTPPTARAWWLTEEEFRTAEWQVQ
jgi:[CysO sulfur-carrier protein]-S-L-cysteine hydrolase